MSEKQSLVETPPPEYQPPPQQAPPGYAATPYTPPPQGGGYQNQTTTATVYVQPAQQSRTVLVGVQPPNYLVLSIVTTVFFCWVFGLIALVIGQKVDTLWLRGNREEALRQSRLSRKWNIAAIVTGVVIYMVVVVLSIGARVAAAAAT